ncbi:hypothetical protein ABMA28_003397 [Loxostege sticticalis]|uniref:Uncharacterized protein n=1 Tax=Loxostege sticticalis TaxID=481309 RepID=A0ABD0SVY5_LOXSC
MRSELLLLFLIGVCCAYGVGAQKDDWKVDQSYNNGKYNQDGNEYKDDKDYKYGGDDKWYEEEESWKSGNKDRDQMKRGDKDPDIYYPCDFEDDIDCVRHYFASSGQCKEVHNYANKPVYRDRLVAYVPGLNLTAVLVKSRLTFVGDKIIRFYINKKTQNLVMAVDFKSINVDTIRTTFIYQRRGQEPFKLADYTNGTFTVTLTAVIPIKKGIDFKESRVTAYISSIEQVEIGPKVLTSTEPVAVKTNAAIYADLPKAVLEYYLTEGPSSYFAYLQKYICDFGIPISS